MTVADAIRAAACFCAGVFFVLMIRDLRRHRQREERLRKSREAAKASMRAHLAFMDTFSGRCPDCQGSPYKAGIFCTSCDGTGRVPLDRKGGDHG